MSRLLTAAAAFVAVSMLAACDGGPASKPSRDQAEAGGAPSAAANAGDSAIETAAGAVDGPADAAPKVDPRTRPAPLLDGKPLWAANRRLTATEAAEKQFARNGEAFGAKTLNDYVRKAHAFIENPPVGAETLTRPYGKLIYDAASNTFAAADKDGTPRAMFKPDDGPAYWAQQKARGDRRASRKRDGGA